MKTTCGIFLFNAEGKFLIGHPTNHPMDLWSIPKGLKDSGESDLVAALRELHEETNIFEKDMGEYKYKHLGLFKYKSKSKTLSAFYFETTTNFENVDIKCDSMVTHTKGPNFPEIDDFRWVSIEESRSILHDSQLPCLDIIDKIRKHVTQV